ncbi:aminotransferase-like domain-containing protein [Amphritea balenae]|uniref:PLP-dependent aminotransferase family protein n=1 Tax=Amphritea balenae TaxID=452629 RepID=A0A3P1SLD7_9GAMM|nr:PLP-dependent aminotransferase family protein [Amphritea balenae]RRC98083.1 PLP-dependent aminotransferase family protein [Amphritea balenae]GGK67420.1 GntR family transcriptional regulator [Amphritea balenae]
MDTSDGWNNLQPSYIREILSSTQADQLISLAGGLPATDLLPTELFAPYLNRLCGQPELFQYGESEGYSLLRQHLHQQYNLALQAKILITSGSQQGLDLIARTFLDHNSEIAMESPCYLGALQVFQLTGCKIHGIRQLAEGPDIEQLERLFRGGRIKLFYAVPDFHNPTGLCWSAESRYQIAKLCRQYGVTLIEDAPYRELRFAGKQLPMMAELCPELTLTLRSFSKTLSPGIRLACLYGPALWIDQICRLKQAADLHSALPFQAILPELLDSEAYKHHLSKLRQRYASNYNLLSTEISNKLGNRVQYQAACGGMFLWLKLKSEIATPLTKHALSHGLAVVPGQHFMLTAKDDRYLRLNFSHSTDKQLIQAVNILEHCFESVN